MNNDILMKIKDSISGFELEKVKGYTLEAIKENIDPIAILDAYREVLNKFGEDFGNKKIFLPELIGAASTVENSLPLVLKEIKEKSKKIESFGTVAIGTVYGDIHTIGKAMVATLLIAGGFMVIDLGINVSTEKFLEAVRNNDVDILAMSSLLTTTAMEQKKVIEQLVKENLRKKVKIIVGGGAITKEFAEEIGADGYDPTATGAVILAKELLKSN